MMEWLLNAGGRKVARLGNKRRFRPGAPAGWEAAMLEFEHQAEHWDTPDHGETGHLIASALRAAVDIAQSGGLRCEHRPGSLSAEERDASSAARDSIARDKATVTQTAGGRRHSDGTHRRGTDARAIDHHRQ
jgi:hypothetical protein